MTRDEIAEAIKWADLKIKNDAFPTRYSIKMLARLRNAAEAAAPKVCETREVERWHVEYADDCGDARVDGAYRTVEDAERAKGWRLKEGCLCVRVTGPHRHEVPA